MAKISEKPRINLIGPYLRNLFGEKTVKLSIDGGFTCPNRDGTLGYSGCSFCSEMGSGENASDIEGQINLLSGKWPNVSSYIAYFQNFTGTYDNVESLRTKYYTALSHQGIRGLAIATRPDCLADDVLELLKEISSKHFLWIELGLQTCNDSTAKSFGRGYETSVYFDAATRLNGLGIPFVTHLLLGLPGESKDDMKYSLNRVMDSPESSPWGLKFHLLNLVRGTPMASQYPDYMPFQSPEEYIELVCDLLEMTPYETIIHRLSADSPKETLIAPKWAYRKRPIIDGIHAEMKRRDSYQGDKEMAIHL